MYIKQGDKKLALNDENIKLTATWMFFGIFFYFSLELPPFYLKNFLLMILIISISAITSIIIVTTIFTLSLKEVSNSIVSIINDMCNSKLKSYSSKYIKVFSFKWIIKNLCFCIVKSFELLNKIGNQELKNSLKLASVFVYVSLAAAEMIFLTTYHFMLIYLMVFM